jgi:hypothetical protein
MDTKVLSVPYFLASLIIHFLGQYKISKLLSLSGHYISPTIPPIPPGPEPTAPSAHPIWTLPPPPPNLGAVFLFCSYMFIISKLTY